MSPALLGELLAAAIVLLYWQHTCMAAPVVTLCRCGDLVRHAPGWPAQCPSCKSLII
ncbi:MAG: hypothetical protein M3R61_00125 [Chloroflexota bacterium]|nr:hypothetical protein [Chloroflexota bacterium]